MRAFYQLLTTIKDLLKEDKFCNTVTTGDILSIDLNKKTIFPLSHIIVNQATLSSRVWTFDVSVLSMDLVDISKELVTDLFVGNDNEQDVMNTQLAVQNRFLEVLKKRSDVSLYEISDSTHEPFNERFENNLSGWSCTFSVTIPNEMINCELS